MKGGKEGERKGGQWLLWGGWFSIAVKQTLRSCKTGGIFNLIVQMPQQPAHKRTNFYQFLWVIPLNWSTIGFDWAHALLPHPITPPTLAFPLVSLYLLDLPCSWSWATMHAFPAQTHSPPPQPPSLLTRSPRQPVWQIGRWDTWHQFKQETRIRLDMWFSVKSVSGERLPQPPQTHT